MMLDHLTKAGAAAMIGLVVGWGANALTMGGRVDAIERSLIRIEARLYTVPVPPPQQPSKP